MARRLSRREDRPTRSARRSPETTAWAAGGRPAAMSLLGHDGGDAACDRAWTARSRCARSSSRSIPAPARSRQRPGGHAPPPHHGDNAERRGRRIAVTEPLLLSQNLSRRLASGGLRRGARCDWMVFDPATLRNAPVRVDVGARSWSAPAGVHAGVPRGHGVRRHSDVVGDRHGQVVRARWGDHGARSPGGRARQCRFSAQGPDGSSAVVPSLGRTAHQHPATCAASGSGTAPPPLERRSAGVGQSVDGDIVETRETERARERGDRTRPTTWRPKR